MTHDKPTHPIKTIVLCTLFLTALFDPKGLAQSPPANKADAKGLVVNIDNPNFRRLNLAVPDFAIQGELTDGEVQKNIVAHQQQLSKWLRFSGLFAAADPNSVKSLPIRNFLNVTEENFPATASLELGEWQQAGVDTVVVGKFIRQEDSVKLELRAFDTTHRRLIIGKRYTVEEGNLQQTVKRFANLLVESYTGKPGIFFTKIALVGRKSQSSHKQIYLCDLDGSNLEQITEEKGLHLSPQWSPDGRYITYTSYQDRNPDLFIYDTTNKERRKISGRQGLNSGANWAPNGKTIAFTGSKNGDANLFTISPDGSNRRILIKGHGLDVDPAFSPDSKWLAFVSGRYGNPHIFLATLEWSQEDSVRVIGDKRLTYAGWYNATPAWTPDSKKILFAGYDKDIDRFDIFSMNYDGSNLERLTLKSGNNESPSLSPDGSLVVFQSNRIGNTNVKGRDRIFTMHRDGSGQTSLDLPLYSAETPKWSPRLETF